MFTGSPLGLLGDIQNYDLGSESLSSIFSSQNEYFKFQKTSGLNNSVLATVNSLHEQEIYDISTNKIIEKFKDIDHLRLKWADFAYLKEYNIYPNNRVIILRRYAGPINDDLYSVSSEDGAGEAISTIIGYVGEEDFLSFNISEKWLDADASFTDILNDVSEDFGFKQFKMGTLMEQGLSAMPLPGASQLLQRRLLVEMGILSEKDIANIPSGSPNLIKDAKVRGLLKDDSSGSGLNGKIGVTFTTTYEQKFFNGVDPTLVYMDIIGTLLSMGTSKSVFYLGNGESKMASFIQDMIKDPMDALKKFIEATIKVFKETLKEVSDTIKGIVSNVGPDLSILDLLFSQGSDDTSIDIKAMTSNLSNVLDKAINYISDFIRDKYRVRALGVLSALTGAPSTPWHITIGNPFRPILCSGDMVVEDINIKLGPQLSFNDLPTFITATIRLTTARDLGLQEIFSKFNSGGIRTTKASNENIDFDGYLIQPNFDNGVSKRPRNFWSERLVTKSEAQQSATNQSNFNQQLQSSGITTNVNGNQGTAINPDANSATTTTQSYNERRENGQSVVQAGAGVISDAIGSSLRKIFS